MVKASGGDLIEEFLKKGEVFVNFSFFDDLKKYKTVDEIKNNLNKFRNPSPNRNVFSQLYKIAHEMKVGDYVLTYDPKIRSYYFGEIISDYGFEDTGDYDPKHYRKVK